MGALIRATRDELEESSRDADWWPGFLARVTDSGYKALPEVAGECAWSWGAFRQWVKEKPEREAEFQDALRDYAEKMVLESIPIADAATEDDVAVAKLRGDRRMQVAGKLDREKWGERVKVENPAGVLLDAGLVGLAGALLAQLSAPKRNERPEPIDVTPQVAVGEI